MTVSNVGIASLLSDPFGKTATETMSYLLEHTDDFIDEKAVCKLIKKGAKAKFDEIIEAIRGYNIEIDQAKKLESASQNPLYFYSSPLLFLHKYFIYQTYYTTNIRIFQYKI